MTRCMTQKRAPLARDRVLRAALEQLPPEGGTAALTMQRIGRRLGVEAMSLYRHVRNKDDIVDGIVDLVLAEIELPADRSNWRTVLRAQAIFDPRGRAPASLGMARMKSRLTPRPGQLPHTRGHHHRPARRRVLGGHGGTCLQASSSATCSGSSCRK